MTKAAFDSVYGSLSARICESAKSIAKVILQSRRCHLPTVGDMKRLIILGNGPSLNETIRDHSDILKSTDTLAVNFAANSRQFFDIRPKYYLLADPHFYKRTDDPNVASLIENLSRVDWPMILFLPRAARKAKICPDNRAITLIYYNAVGAEGFPWLTRRLYRSGLAMPRPRNVLIPSIMIGMLMGYREIFIVGADHSWTRTLSVDDENNVISVQPHFYEEDERETRRISHEYKGYHLHQILHSFYTAFRSYHQIRDYADSCGVSIYNGTPGSFIDAFERKPLS